MNNVDLLSMRRDDQMTDHQKSFSAGELQNWLQRKLSELLEISQAEIDIHQPFNEYGLSSAEAVSLAGELAELLDGELSPTIVYDYPTIARLTHYLVTAQTCNEQTTERATPSTPPAVAESQAADPLKEDAIAIIGMACRFPGGATTPEAFWQLLKQGKDAITEIPAQRWKIDDYYDPSPETPGKMYTRYGCFLEDLEQFDAGFFGFSPRETVRMDPQQRLLLEVAWEALENAGLPADSLAGSPTGVFIGMMNNYEYTQLQMQQGDESWIDDPYFGTGSASSMVSGRLAYHFDFQGPTLTVDTACSSSLVSLHLACQSLRHNECSLALVGGTNAILWPENMVNACKMGMLAADGRCKTFDAAADGFVLGEGCGLVVLKRLSQAQADGNTILAIVRGSAVNQDGKSNGITAPNRLAQEAVIRKALASADLAPARVSYVEAHGSGTALGDPIEIGALEAVLGAGRSAQQQLLVGTVKTNIGHLAGAAGIAGLIKTILALQHKEIPPHLNLRELNPHIAQQQSAIAIPTRLTPWPAQGETRIAGVSSFGWSGTNAHVVLEEAPPDPCPVVSQAGQLLILSARTAAALETMIANLHTYLQHTPDSELADLAFTLQTGRMAFAHRYMQVSTTVAEASKQLENKQGITTTITTGSRKLLFLFREQSALTVNMALELYRKESVFSTEFDRCAELLKPHLCLDLRTILYPSKEQEERALQQLQHAEFAQPLLFTITYALAKLWQSWGVSPQGMLGYGMGEYVAACLAGVFTLEDALLLVVTKGRLRQTPDPFVVDLLTTLVQRMPLQAPTIPYLSNLSGDWITEQEATDPAYWVRHLMHTTCAHQDLERHIQGSDTLLLEVGPSHACPSLATQRPTGQAEQRIFTSLRHTREQGTDHTFLLNTWGQLWCMGAPIKWSARYAIERRRYLPLLTYPFERKRYWIDLTTTSVSPPLKGENTKPASTTIEKQADIGSWFYQPGWQRVPLPPIPEQTQTTVQKWLIFMDEVGPGARLAEHIERTGQTVIRVQAGQQFAQEHTQSFTLRPGEMDDYKRLCQTLFANGQIPQVTVHCWSVTIDIDTRSRFQQRQDRGFYSLLHFVQALTTAGLESPHRLVVLSNQVQRVTGQEILQPEKAPLLGLCRVIPQEYPHIACCSIDLNIAHGEDWQDAIEPCQLVAECSRTLSDLVLAYRAGERWVQSYQPLHLASSRPPLRQRGVYLITGGLGNIALLLAEYLAKTVQARLILVSRSTLPPRSSWDTYAEKLDADKATLGKIQRIQSIEAQGAEVLLLQADIADKARMQAIVEQVYARFGDLHGVIHAAGLVTKTAFKPVELTDQTTCELHFQPKVYGTIALEQALQERTIDFCLLFSSISAVLGGLGFAAYSASNAFLDAFAQEHNRHSTVPWISVNWDGWPSAASTAQSGGASSALVMTEPESWEAFTRVLASGQTHLVHSTGNLDARIKQWLRPESAQSAFFAAQSMPAKSAARIVPDQIFSRLDYEQKITSVWQQVLGLQDIRPDDNFFDIGGNSLLTFEVIARLKKMFQRPLPTTALFEAPTINALVNYLQPIEEQEAAQISPKHHSAPPKKEVTADDIAIIGMAGRFPGAATVDEFWQNLRNGRETISFFSEQELLEAGVSPTHLKNPRYVRARPVLQDIDLFDATFFDYSPREAELMDPQHRLFLECSWEALEHACYDPSTYKGSIGVYAGANLSTYLLSLMTDKEMLGPVNDYQVVIGNDKDSLTTTVSYKLNLKGPSFAVQTFCSTSLVAVHLACQSLRRGECQMALAGGVSVRVPWKVGYLYEEGGMESPDGHCRTFDAQARGSLFGDGVAAVVLKPLSQALADGDTVHAVIKGSAINNDGSLKVSYTAPSVVGQSEVITAALIDAGVKAESISYIEAHGTATTLGDPIEVAALTKAFRTQTDKQKFCALGSVKTNVGHLDRAAGVTGLIKTVQALKEKEIPASLHYQSPNPEINFADSPFYVNTSLSRWTHADGPRRAGVSSLGMGGTNAHVIVEEAPELPASGPSRPWQLLLISARTATALETATKNLHAYLQAHKEIPLADIAYTLQKGRKRFEYRRLLLSRDHDEAIRILEQSESPHVFTRVGRRTDLPVTFMFPGIGEQSVGMAEEIYYREAAFRQVIDHCSELLQVSLHIDLRQILFTGMPAVAIEQSPATARSTGVQALLRQNGNTREHCTAMQAGKPTQTAIAQPIAFVIEYALAQLLIHWGIQPQALLGHSLGEYVAACLAGIFSLEDALILVTRQAELMQELPQGMMLAVTLSEQEAQVYVNERVNLAIINAPRTCVLSGPIEDMQHLEERLAAEGVSHIRVDSPYAFHSALLEPLQHELMQTARSIKLNPPHIPCLSNATGTWITDEQATDPAYWAHHMCQTVRFMDNIAHLLQETEGVLLEVGPGQMLSSFVKQHPLCERERMASVLTAAPLPLERHAEYRSLLLTLGKLWLSGVNISWQGFYAHERRRNVPLPAYPFERGRYWIAPRTQPILPAAPGSHTCTISAQPGTSSSSGIGTQILPKEALADWFYVPGWRSALRRPAQKAEPVPDGSCQVVFLNTTSLNLNVAQRLRDLGGNVITVRNAEAFAQIDEATYTVNPIERNDYAMLFEHLRMLGKQVQHIVLLWSIREEGQTIADALHFGLYSLIALAQALGDAELEECQLKVITSETQAVTGDERISPVSMSLAGPCRVLTQEYANLRCSTIDILLPQPDSQQETDVVRLLVDEIITRDGEALVVLRANRRWLPNFEALHLQKEERQTLPLRSGGVYLITGGLGGIGLAVAHFLAHEYQARLVLLGRNGLPAPEQWSQILIETGTSAEMKRRIQQLQSLKAMGTEVLIVQADIRNEEQMRSAVRQAQEQFGTIHGVFHAAGVPGVGLTQFKTMEQVRDVLGPKVEGTIALEKALEGVAIDLLVLFSSIAAQIGGGPGQLDYSAANAFLGTYALSQKERSRRVVTIDWGEWQWNAWETGLSGYNTQIQTFLRENRQHSGITFGEGMEALKRVLATELAHVIVSPQNFHAKIEETEQLTATHSTNEAQEPHQIREKHPRPELATSYVPPRNDIEQSIASLWESLLGITPVGINDNFFELGGNSLIGIDLIARLRRMFHLKSLASYMLYEAPTVSLMAQYIEKGQSAQEVKERIDRGEKRRESRQRTIHEARRARRQSHAATSDHAT